MRTFFSPTPGRLGVSPTLLTSGRLNTGTLAAGTQIHALGGYPGVPAGCWAFCISATEFPTAATSCAVRVLKRPAAGGAAVPLTGSLSINNITDNVAHQIPVLTTLTDAQRTLEVGAMLEVELVTVGAVSVQPVNLAVVAELLPFR
jgi:hypothetical protein